MCVTDQMGVELGKVLAKKILAQLGSPGDVKGHDSSVCFFLLLLSTVDRRMDTDGRKQ